MISKEQLHRSHLLQVYTTSKDIQRAPQLTSLLPKSMLVTSHPENISDSQNTCYQNAHLAYHIQRLPHPLLHGMHDLTSHQRVTPHPRTISYLLQVVHASEHTATTIIKCMNNQPHISMTKGRPDLDVIPAVQDTFQPNARPGGLISCTVVTGRWYLSTYTPSLQVMKARGWGYGRVGMWEAGGVGGWGCGGVRGWGCGRVGM